MANKTEYYKELIEHTKSKSSNARGLSKYCYIFPEHVVLKCNPVDLLYSPSQQQKAIAKIKSLGFQTPSIVYHTEQNNKHYEVQEKAIGKPLFCDQYDYPLTPAMKRWHTDKLNAFLLKENKERFVELLAAPDHHFIKYVENFTGGHSIGFLEDCHSSNIFYDSKKGFTFIDLGELPYWYSKKDFKNYFENVNDMDEYSFDTLARRIRKPFANDWCTNMENIKFKGPFLNLIGHKLYSAFKNSNLNFDNEHMEFLKERLINTNASNFNTCCDYDQKLLLIKFGMLEPTEKDKKFVEDKDNQEKYSHFIINQSMEEIEKEIDVDFYKQCINASLINGIPAVDYFNQISEPVSISSNEDSLEL